MWCDEKGTALSLFSEQRNSRSRFLSLSLFNDMKVEFYMEKHIITYA